MPFYPRALAAVLIAAFAQAVLAPCPIGSAPDAEPHTALSAHAHHGDDAHDSLHVDGDSDQVGRPCPCGCGGEGPAVAPGVVVAHALITATPELPALTRAALLPGAGARLPIAPVRGDEAVPRKA